MPLFVIALTAIIAGGVGLVVGMAVQYNRSRERLRLRIMEANLENLSEKQIN
jgi:hypothetical protein